MNCQRCGTQFQGSFCPNCGAPAGSPPIGGQPVPGEGDNARAHKPVTKRWWFWALCVLTLLVLIGTLSSLPKDSAKTAEEEPVSIVEEAQPEETAAQKSSLGKAASVGTEGTDTSESEGNALEAPGAKQSAEATVGETVLLDQNGIRITTVSLENDAWMGPALHVLIENNTDANVAVQINDSDVNGAMMSAIFSCDVSAGKKANGEITFMQSDLDAAGIETIQTISFYFSVLNPETWETLFDSDPVTVKTSAAGTFTQAFDQTGQVILDRDGLKVVARGLDTSDEIWGPRVLFFIENSSGRDFIVQTENSSINGFMVDSFFSCHVRAGKVAYTDASFFTEDLEENGITAIQTFEFSLHIVDANSWDTLFDSEPIALEF